MRRAFSATTVRWLAGANVLRSRPAFRHASGGANSPGALDDEAHMMTLTESISEAFAVEAEARVAASLVPASKTGDCRVPPSTDPVTVDVASAVVALALAEPHNGNLVGTALEGRTVPKHWASEKLLDISTSFRRADFRGAQVVGCSFCKGADFDMADCEAANFAGSQFRDLSFTAASLTRADLRRCTFHRCVFRRANLREADIRGATFVQCDFALCDLSNARTSSDTTFFEPEHWWQSRRSGWPERGAPRPWTTLPPEDYEQSLPARDVGDHKSSGGEKRTPRRSARRWM